MTATADDLARVLALSEQGHSQREIAMETGLSQTTVSRMLRGEWTPRHGQHQTRLGGGAAVTSPLGAALLQALKDDPSLSADDLTVLTPANDPFRLDSPARHREAKWVADTAGRLGLGSRRIHWRGLHYMLLGQPKPDGTPYTNTDENWQWLYKRAAKAARWLGYIPWEQIEDHRNSEPVVRKHSKPDPRPFLYGGVAGLELVIPPASELMPAVSLDDFGGSQPYHLVIFGEKSSLEAVLGPLAGEFEADLYLMTGEMSDTYLHRIATDAIEDGRPMVVLVFADCDPAGWQMGISIARKLQAFEVLYADLPQFQVRRAALTPEQVRRYGLPETPLKPKEKRKANWMARMGAEQTEIDALVALRPELLRDIARDALGQFYDRTLASRVREAEQRWLREASEALQQQLEESGDLPAIEAAAEELAGLQERIDDLNDQLQLDSDDFELPELPEIPEATESAAPPNGALLDSRWEFTDQCRRLKDSKAYTGDEDDELEEG